MTGLMTIVAQASQSQPSPMSYLGWLLPLVVIGIVVTFVWNSLISVAVYRMSKTDRNIESLQANLHEMANKLVDARLRAATHEVNNHVQSLVTVIDDLKARLADNEDGLGALSGAGHSIEKDLIRSVDSLKEYVRTNAAEKRAFEDFCKETRTGRESLLQALAKLERQVVTSEDLKRILQEVRHGG